VEKLAPELMKQYGDFIVDVLLRGISTRHWEKTAPAERGTSLWDGSGKRTPPKHNSSL
jgi:hypothetical protein